MDYLERFYKFLCCITDPVFPVPYNFSFGSPLDLEINKKTFESNFVKTSKYSWYDFLPKALIIQFKRLANIYFLVIAILQTIPIISPLGPLTAWAPLIVVLAISIVRQGYEDYQRYKSDQELNFQLTTQVFREGSFRRIQWSEVIIGDLVRTQIEQLFPVDLILLSSSGQGGVAFIETASLDGQKNLKPRGAFPKTQSFNNEQALCSLNGKWEGIVPDKQLHNFSSNMTLSSGQVINYYKDKQLLYRGARLKNTKWIIGLCIYTGRNTKIMMNSDSSSEKMSQIEVKVNRILGIILLIQLSCCLIVAICDAALVANYRTTDYYISFGDYSAVLDGFLMFCSYFVLINTMIPISLIVSIQIVKMSQSYFIDKDKLMYSDFRKKFANVKSASLNEQLGQIQYVFTDKTGTLTMNLMEFKIAVIGSKMFGDLGLIIKDSSRPPQNYKGFHDDELRDIVNKVVGSNNYNVTDVFAKDRDGRQQITFASMKQLAEQYLTILALAHEVVAQTNKKGQKFYQGPSPDEITLVDAAREMGFQFEKSSQNTTQLKVRGQSRKFELLEVFPFTSDRKRMSVVIRSGNYIKMYMKGADSIVKGRLASDSRLNLDDELNRFAKIGLRTLLVGMRLISEQEYNQFKKGVEGLPPTNKEEAYEKLVSQLEQGIYLIGATAVLDRLQEQVPETIRDLIRAKIKIWMLTGDKMETAQNIAKSCNLIQPHFEVLKYQCNDAAQILNTLKDLTNKAQQLSAQGQAKGFLIEGQDLTPIIGHPDHELELSNLAKYCDAVVCCRLLPIQKAEVVRIVRTYLNKITLSIGDGANDVPMIKTAHIGVGLFGEEGMGAVQASDYALPQFRMLWRLLLVHGRWNYIRIAQMILYFFYKNMLFTVPQFIFAFYCGYSAQTIFDDVYISLYNLIFTSLPLVIRAIFQQDIYYVRPAKQEPRDSEQQTMTKIVKPHVLDIAQSRYIPKDYEINKYLYRLFPKIYFIGQENCIFNYTNFFLWILEGVLQALVICLFSIYIFSAQSLNNHGYSNDLWLASLTIFTSVVLVVTFKLATHTKFWSVLLIISILFFSLALYVGYMWLSNYGFSTYLTGTVYTFFTNGQTYFVIIFCCALVLLVDGIVLHVDFNRGAYSSRMRKLVESERQHNKKNFEEESIRDSDINTYRPAE